jgi:mono/diheme cytochrome c family protein
MIQSWRTLIPVLAWLLGGFTFPTVAAVNETPEPGPTAVSPAPTAPPRSDTNAPRRGQLLYENHCQACHTSVVHVREKRRAKTYAELRAWVVRWGNELKVKWENGEADEIAEYLNRRYYQFNPGTQKP